MSPANSTPWKGTPSLAMPSTVGCTMSSTTMRSISGVTTGAGEYAPMPPVFGPVSPSPTGLWSCAETRGKTFLPSVMAKKLASSPAMYSSITTRDPALPKTLPTSMSSMASSAIFSSMATMTPFPAASPSALTTMGAPCSFTYALAFSASSNTAYAAVSTLYLAQMSFMKALEPSSSAAALLGPKTLNPASLRESDRPATRGASGPTTISSTLFSLQKDTTAAWSSMFNLSPLRQVMFSSSAIPGLPGAQNSCSQNGDRLIFQARACSRPPPPTTRTFNFSFRSPACTDRTRRALRAAARCMWIRDSPLKKHDCDKNFDDAAA
mmetsp:Transcript_21548/g.47288  ORF Transcript_21548/g.47288 Transcript_21548/m.47288 type:complete len:323 (+) Transcript_21548:841-1809(+)